MRSRFKPLIGKILLSSSEQLPWTKPLLRRWGIRTSQEWFENRVVTIQLPEGKHMRLTGISENYLTFELFWKGFSYYEPITMMLTRELAKERGLLFDVGANVGVYSLTMALLVPGLKVVAFEPNPKAFQLLKANLRLNHLDQVVCEPVAVSDHEGKGTLYLCPSDMSASLEEDFEAVTGGREVTKTTLDSYWHAHRSESKMILKVDVEGHESALFRGAIDLLEEKKPEIICEITGPLREDVTAFLRKIGYQFYAITNQGLLSRDEISLTVHQEYLFLNYLFTTAPASAVTNLFNRIKPQVDKLDLSKTSKRVSPEMIARLRAREGFASAGNKQV